VGGRPATGASTGTAASGWTERLDFQDGNNVNAYAMERLQATAGASPTATPTFTGSAGATGTWTYAIGVKSAGSASTWVALGVLT
jgi:hypothetical protein